MLNSTVNSSLCLIRIKNLCSDGDELIVVDCSLVLRHKSRCVVKCLNWKDTSFVNNLVGKRFATKIEVQTHGYTHTGMYQNNLYPYLI